MGLREYLGRIENEGKLLKVAIEVSTRLEISGFLKAMEPRPVLFEKVKESPFRVAGNLFCSKEAIASYFGAAPSSLIPLMIKAIEKREKPEVTATAACQEVVKTTVDLDTLPILYHCDRDGGNYISSAIVITRDPEYGQNVDYHRAMQFAKDKMSVRVVKGRHFDKFLEKNGELEVAFCIGASPNVLIAAAISVDIGFDELEMANALEELKVVKAKSVDLLIPAECEFVLEGRVYAKERHSEGPFVDLTETYDAVRQEPVFEVKTITHRKDGIWQALLPGALEHKLLMGMPREPTIFKRVNDLGVKCLDVNVNPGGCSWLHAIVQIDTRKEDDGVTAIKGAFEGHTSCKHAFIVDKDIDIYNPLEVEWAMATRFQADRDLVVRQKERGSSLDPSSELETHLTTKVGFDLTKPLVVGKGKSFDKAKFPAVDVKKYLER